MKCFLITIVGWEGERVFKNVEAVLEEFDGTALILRPL